MKDYTAVNKEKVTFNVLFLFGLIFLIGILLMSPIVQNQSYHQFCDNKILFNINNFWNVISNLPFFIVGFLGIYNIKVIAENRVQYLVFFIGVLFVSIGSAYYHFNPNNDTLIFDRLPMTLVFMALTSIIISEFINVEIGRKLLIPMLLLGLSSVLYWIYFEDLSLYVFVQFYPMLVIPIVLICFKSSYTHVYGYWLLYVFYIVAKGCEYYDNRIFSILKGLSGHSLKHVISAIGLYVLYRTFIKRVTLKIKN